MEREQSTSRGTTSRSLHFWQMRLLQRRIWQLRKSWASEWRADVISCVCLWRRDCHRHGISRQGGMAGHIFVLVSIPASRICIWEQRHQPPLLSFKLSVAVTGSKITGHWQRPTLSFPRLVALLLPPPKLHLGNVECQSNLQSHLIQAHHPLSISDSHVTMHPFLSPSFL